MTDLKIQLVTHSGSQHRFADETRARGYAKKYLADFMQTGDFISEHRFNECGIALTVCGQDHELTDASCFISGEGV